MATNQSAETSSEESNVSYMKDYKKTARVIAVTSGKGGVGKTNICTNLSIALAQTDKKVCVIDADLGLANINILLGQYPKYTLEDLLEGSKTIEEVAFEGPAGIRVIPGATGLGQISDLNVEKQGRLVAAIEKLEATYDYIFIDTSAGISSEVLSFVESANEAVVVVSPEPTSLTDAYSLIKVLQGRGYKKNIYTVVNMVLSYDDSMKIFSRLNGATKKYLKIDLKYLGFVMMDQAMVASVIQQKPIMIMKPDSNPSRCFTTIAGKFDSVFNAYGTDKFSDYWRGNSSLEDVNTTVDNNGSEAGADVVSESSVKTQENDEQQEVTVKEKTSEGDSVESEEDSSAEMYETKDNVKAPPLDDVVGAAVENSKDVTSEEAADVPIVESPSGSEAEANVESENKLTEGTEPKQSTGEEDSNVTEEKVADEGVVTTPVDVQEQYRAGHPLRVDLSSQELSFVEIGSLSEEKAKKLIQKLESAFVDKFNKQPFDLKDVLYASLGLSDFSEESIKDIALVLESIYEKRSKKQLFDLRDIFIRLLADSSVSEEKMKNLFQVIEKSYQRLFEKPLVDLDEKIVKTVMQDDFSEKSFAGLITSLHGMYKERFGRALKTSVDFPDSRFDKIVSEMDQADSEISDILNRITGLKKTREDLIKEMKGIVQNFLKEE